MDHKQDINVYCKVIKFRGCSISKMNCVKHEFNLQISLYKMGYAQWQSAYLTGMHKPWI